MNSLEACQLCCANMPSATRPQHCRGIEYTYGHCEFWTRQIGHTSASNGYKCLDYSRSAVTLRAPHDGLFFAVGSDGSVKANRHSAHPHDGFHKITNDDDTVSFLSYNGKFLTAAEDGTVGARATTLQDWEKFSQVRHGQDEFSYRSAHKTYLMIDVDDSTLKATATRPGPRTTFIERPVGSGRKVVTTPPPDTSVFDCELKGNWSAEWPLGKKAYCCQHFQKGCPGALQQKSIFNGSYHLLPQKSGLTGRARYWFLGSVVIAASVVGISFGIIRVFRVRGVAGMSGRSYHLACEVAPSSGEPDQLYCQPLQSSIA